MYRVGIIGLGRIACELPDNHLKAYEECEQTKVAVLCDIDKNKFFDCAAKIPQSVIWLNINSLYSVEDMNLDIVSVCTPPNTHRDIVCCIAPYVKAIFCEKPITESLEDAQDMIDVCKHCGTILQVNCQRNFMNPVFKFSRGWMNTGIHAVSLARYLFKPEIKVEYIHLDTDEPVFELDCTHNKEPMILEGVKHLIDCIENGHESILSGEVAKEDLREVLNHT